MRNVLATLLTAGALLGAAGSASAANPATTTFLVSATVLKNCTVSALPLNFGNYTPLGGALTVNTTVSVSCTTSTPFNTELTAGLTGGSSIAQRLLNNGAGQTLQYNLYTTCRLRHPVGYHGGHEHRRGSRRQAWRYHPWSRPSLVSWLTPSPIRPRLPGLYTDTITVTLRTE